jgi:hypothetical protein
LQSAGLLPRDAVEADEEFQLPSRKKVLVTNNQPGEAPGHIEYARQPGRAGDHLDGIVTSCVAWPPDMRARASGSKQWPV